MYCDCPHLGRCCFCMPLRRGVITFGYINILCCAYMVGMFSYLIHYSGSVNVVHYGPISNLPKEFCLAIYCIDFVFNAILIYGAHLKSILYIKVFYYYAIMSTLASVLIQILDVNSYEYVGNILEMTLFIFTGLCIQVYLIALVRSLLRKMELDEPHLYENPLNQIVTGENRVESNGIYNNTTVEPADV